MAQVCHPFPQCLDQALSEPPCQVHAGIQVASPTVTVTFSVTVTVTVTVTFSVTVTATATATADDDGVLVKLDTRNVLRRESVGPLEAPGST
ncbi:unnamed protein product [Closterium sp. NIES-64]|nr:unnamed protein product [Closterium sp. NIES-64]